jgi:hypothetical protein
VEVDIKWFLKKQVLKKYLEKLAAKSMRTVLLTAVPVNGQKATMGIVVVACVLKRFKL